MSSHNPQVKNQSTKNHKKSDGKFRSKNIKHDPQAESARASIRFAGAGSAKQA